MLRDLTTGRLNRLLGGSGGCDRGGLRALTGLRLRLLRELGLVGLRVAHTHLTGREEVLTVPEGAPHPSDSHAQGQAIFRVGSDGTVHVRLIASNIRA